MSSDDQIVNRMVSDEKDVPGMIAYYSYKMHKIRYCQQIESKHERPPNEDEINHFLLMMDDCQIKKLRNEADFFLKEFTMISAGNIINDEVTKAKIEIEETEAKNNKELKMALSVAKQPGYFYGVSQGIVANFLFILLIGIIALVLSATRYDIIGATIGFVQKLTQQDSQKQSPPP